MELSRRGFLSRAGGGLAGAALAARLLRERAQGQGEAIRVGMCDWNLGKRADLGGPAVAAEIGLDGIEASLCTGLNPFLREEGKQAEYLAEAEKHGIEIPSLALGELNSVPLKSEDIAAQWVAESVPAAEALGASCILLAFFGAGEIDMGDEAGLSRIVGVLKDVAPAAREAGVILGLENTLRADDNLRILERVGDTEAVQVYYDCKNSANGGNAPIAEIKQLGKELLCQVHFKNGAKHLDETDNVDFAACSEALQEVGYEGWIILETSAPNGLIEDTRHNMEYVKELFGA